MPNLPPRASGRDWNAIKEQLISEPNVWVLIGEGWNRHVYSMVRNGRIAPLRDKKWFFECSVRNTKAGVSTADVWMMARPRTRKDGDRGLQRR